MFKKLLKTTALHICMAACAFMPQQADAQNLYKKIDENDFKNLQAQFDALDAKRKFAENNRVILTKIGVEIASADTNDNQRKIIQALETLAESEQAGAIIDSLKQLDHLSITVNPELIDKGTAASYGKFTDIEISSADIGLTTMLEELTHAYQDRYLKVDEHRYLNSRSPLESQKIPENQIAFMSYLHEATAKAFKYAVLEDLGQELGVNLLPTDQNNPELQCWKEANSDISAFIEKLMTNEQIIRSYAYQADKSAYVAQTKIESASELTEQTKTIIEDHHLKLLEQFGLNKGDTINITSVFKLHIAAKEAQLGR